MGVAPGAADTAIPTRSGKNSMELYVCASSTGGCCGHLQKCSEENSKGTEGRLR